ncbi:MAG TPA: GTPase ObgE [Vicinamibacterales bacterium]|nr:GTPase ObgE [Vicinamibacterales bacterium]
MFVDEVDIKIAAGHGGRGCMSFRREKFVPRGGPNGGDGGTGGSVYLVASPHHNTLVNYRFHPEFHAERGGHGEGSNRTGATGADLELQVPVGTVVYEQTADGLVRLADLAEVGQRVLVARGGRGGFGNAHFATATNRAPRKAQPGEEGEAKQLRLKLKLLADVGLVGFPNAGKSTLISRISAARPKIADYPFTTLTPNLGVVGLSDDRSFVVADVPGLIEGAHAGHGLGHQFLSHLERTKVLVHVIDVSSGSGRDPVQDFEVIQRELELFPGTEEEAKARGVPALAGKPRLAAANKMDALDDPSRLERLDAHLRKRGVPLYRISAVTGEGLPALLEGMWREVARARETRDETSAGAALSSD